MFCNNRGYEMNLTIEEVQDILEIQKNTGIRTMQLLMAEDWLQMNADIEILLGLVSPANEENK